MKKTILIGGGTGMVGKKIIDLLDKERFHVKILSRSKHEDSTHSYAQWDINSMTIDDGVMDDVDYIINLTGAGIADKRWSDERKKAIIDSRVNSTKLLQQAIENSNNRPKAFISASAIGYYGDRSDELLNEKSDPGSDFLAETCIKWENAVTDLSDHVDREVRIRIGLVLSMSGGALPKLVATRKIGIFNYLGSGEQYYSWIHVDDLARIFIAAIENEDMEGPYNAVAPVPLQFKKFMMEVKEGLDSSGLVMPVPAFGVKLLLGEMSSVVLNSTRVLPERLAAIDWVYLYTDLPKAIADLDNNVKQ